MSQSATLEPGTDTRDFFDADVEGHALAATPSHVGRGWWVVAIGVVLAISIAALSGWMIGRSSANDGIGQTATTTGQSAPKHTVVVPKHTPKYHSSLPDSTITVRTPNGSVRNVHVLY
jgi:hypothetical protein